MEVNERLKSRSSERSFFITAALVFSFIVLAGFARTYYLKGFFDTPPLATVMVHVHGLLMTAWVALFVLQVWLISSHRVKTHQRLGFSGIGLGVLIILVGFLVAVRAAKFGAAATPPGIPRLAFLLVPLTDLLMFMIFFGTAIYLRRKPASHKRLMLLSFVCFLPPAVARIPVAWLQALGPLFFFGLPTLLVLLALALDSWRNAKVNKIFLAGTILLILSFVLRLVLMQTETWIRFAGWLTSWAA